MKKGLNERVLDYLGTHNVATLATTGEDKDPWAAAVFYVNDGFTLYFLSSPATRHCQNLARNSMVALTVQEDYGDWQQIKGLQIEGEVRVLSGREERTARKLYGEKFPVVGMLATAPAAIVKALAKVRWYQVIPRRIYFIDNAGGLGHRDEIDLGSC